MRAFADDGVVEQAAIDAGIGADGGAVLDDHPAKMGRQHRAAVCGGSPNPPSPIVGARQDCDAVADQGAADGNVAPMRLRSPIWTPGPMTAFAPMRTPLPMCASAPMTQPGSSSAASRRSSRWMDGVVAASSRRLAMRRQCARMRRAGGVTIALPTGMPGAASGVGCEAQASGKRFLDHVRAHVDEGEISGARPRRTRTRRNARRDHPGNATTTAVSQVGCRRGPRIWV